MCSRHDVVVTIFTFCCRDKSSWPRLSIALLCRPRLNCCALLRRLCNITFYHCLRTLEILLVGQYYLLGFRLRLIRKYSPISPNAFVQLLWLDSVIFQLFYFWCYMFYAITFIFWHPCWPTRGLFRCPLWRPSCIYAYNFQLFWFDPTLWTLLFLTLDFLCYHLHFLTSTLTNSGTIQMSPLKGDFRAQGTTSHQQSCRKI